MRTCLILAFSIATVFDFSCKKETGVDPKPPVRKVRFELFTNEDFAGEKKNIDFRLMIRNSTREIFDSSLATMKVEDIPDFDHRIIVEKLVPGNDQSDLEAGFINFLQDVGSAWLIEKFPAGDTLKVVKWAFR